MSLATIRVAAHPDGRELPYVAADGVPVMGRRVGYRFPGAIRVTEDVPDLAYYRRALRDGDIVLAPADEGEAFATTAAPAATDAPKRSK